MHKQSGLISSKLKIKQESLNYLIIQRKNKVQAGAELCQAHAKCD